MTLDADVVAGIEETGGNLSARVNAVLRGELARRRRHRALGGLLARMDAGDGPLHTPQDEAEIARFMRLPGGPDDSDGA